MRRVVSPLGSGDVSAEAEPNGLTRAAVVHRSGRLWINNGPGNRHYCFVGWQAQYQLSDAWILGAEVFQITAQTTGQSPSAGFNAGGYYVFNPQSQLLFSAGRGLQNANDANRVSAYIGFQLSF